VDLHVDDGYSADVLVKDLLAGLQDFQLLSQTLPLGAYFFTLGCYSTQLLVVHVGGQCGRKYCG
jgi:hypothetical protein